MQQVSNIDRNYVFLCPCGRKGVLGVDPSIAICYRQLGASGMREHILYLHAACTSEVTVSPHSLCIFCHASSVARYTFTLSFPNLHHTAYKFTCSEKCYILAMKQAEVVSDLGIICKGCHQSFPKRAMRWKRGASRVSDERYCRSCLPK